MSLASYPSRWRASTVAYNRLDSEVDIALQYIQNQEEESAISVHQKLQPVEMDSYYRSESSSSLPLSPHPDKPSQRSYFSPNGWRGVLTVSSCATFAITIINIIFLAWGLHQPQGDESNILFTGSCDKARTIDTWLHLVINLMSAAILAASNYSMQLLTAPTRSLIDQAHKNNKYLDIGTASLRNFIAIPPIQKLLWALLLFGSLPLHFFWNSVVISTDQFVDYEALLVTQEYIHGVTPSNVSDPYIDEWGSGEGYLDGDGKPSNWSNSTFGILQSQINKTLQYLPVDECVARIAPLSVRNTGNFILATNITMVPNVSVLDAMRYGASQFRVIETYAWQCGTVDYDYVGAAACLSSHRDPQNWTFSYFNYDLGYSMGGAKVEYCYVDNIPDACTVELLPDLLGIVIVFNILKLISFMSVLYLDLDPILTLGDAIATFLDRAEKPSSDSIRNARSAKASMLRRRAPKRIRFYLESSSKTRLGCTLAFILSGWTVGIILCNLVNDGLLGQMPLSYAWNQGITSFDPSSSIYPSSMLTEAGISNNVTRALVANSPQVLLSMVYLTYNGLMTSMMMAREWVTYARSHIGLRTFKPEGQQRSTYFLSLPYRYSIPIVVAWGFLHWFLSLTFYVTKIQVYESDHSHTSQNTMGLSKLPLLLTVTLETLVIIALFIVGFRRYPKTIPMVGSNSRAISANCWPINTGKREAIQKLKFGLVHNGDELRYTFSSEEVLPLLYHEEFWLQKQLKKLDLCMRNLVYHEDSWLYRRYKKMSFSRQEAKLVSNGVKA